MPDNSEAVVEEVLESMAWRARVRACSSRAWRRFDCWFGQWGQRIFGVLAHGGEWVLVVFLITSSSLKPIALSQFDVGQYASTLGQ
ncbi:hypothetical protein FCV25MIE_09416 [Fagus crenata]